MSRILRVSESNYKVQVQPGGTITLDVGPSNVPDVDQGTVIITGNLRVDGNTTTVNTTNLDIEDNIILLNKGESPSHAGITEGTSGLQIDRGSLVNAYFLFDENVSWYKPAIGTQGAPGYVAPENVPGSWVFKGGAGSSITTGIQVASISIDGTTNLVFDLQNSTRVVELANTGTQGASIEAQATAYANRLMYPTVPESETLNWIPNKKYLSMYINSGVVTPGMADVDKIYRTSGGIERTRIQAYDNYIRVFYDNAGTPEALCSFASNGLTFRNNINIDRNTINNISVSNLVITAAAEVEIDAVLNLDNQTSSPVAVTTATKIYSSATAGAGKTGIYFINKRTGEPGQAINETVSDELIAKNRALLFSMIF